MVIVVLLELGAVELLRSPVTQMSRLEDLATQAGVPADALGALDTQQVDSILSQPKPPGLAIRYMALLDGILLFTVGLMGLSLLITQRIHARVQGCLTLIFALVLLILSIVLIVLAIAAVILMITLFLSAPFGTLAYLAIYGFFNTGGAAAILALLLVLKLGFCGCLVIAQQRFLQNKGLVLMILTSLLANVLIAFLHNLVPGFLVSITDGIAAIVVGILAAIWLIVLLISSLPAIAKALWPSRV